MRDHVLDVRGFHELEPSSLDERQVRASELELLPRSMLIDLVIESRPGAGTSIRARVPLSGSDPFAAT
jgi:hypothetical protein